MSITNYSELQTAVLNWSARGDTAFTSKVPDFIRLGEERIWRNLRLDRMIQFADLTIVSGQNWVALPDDWAEFDTLYITDTGKPKKLEYRSYDALLEQDEGVGRYYYTIKGARLVYGLTPSSDTAISTTYFQRLDLLATTSTNWILTNHPSVYLYSALLEGAVYAKNPAKVGEYGTLYDKAIDETMTADRAAKVSGSRLRMVAR